MSTSPSTRRRVAPDPSPEGRDGACRPVRTAAPAGPRRSLATALAGLAATLLIGGAAATLPAERPSPPTWPDGASPSETPAVDATPILRDVDATAAAAGGSIAVVVVGAGGQQLIAGPDAGDVTYAASLVKPLVVARLLALDRAGSLELSSRDLALMRRAVVASDDDAMNTLWERYDGPRRVQEVAASVGLPETAPPVVPGQWGQTTTTAIDIAVFLSALEDMLDGRDAETLLGWMRSTTAVAADSFDQRFGLLATSSGAVAVKQGWMCCIDDRRQLHSAGVLDGGRVVVLLGDFPASTSWARAASALDTAAATVLAGVG